MNTSYWLLYVVFNNFERLAKIVFFAAENDPEALFPQIGAFLATSAKKCILFYLCYLLASLTHTNTSRHMSWSVWMSGQGWSWASKGLEKISNQVINSNWLDIVLFPEAGGAVSFHSPQATTGFTLRPGTHILQHLKVSLSTYLSIYLSIYKSI